MIRNMIYLIKIYFALKSYGFTTPDTYRSAILINKLARATATS